MAGRAAELGHEAVRAVAAGVQQLVGVDVDEPVQAGGGGELRDAIHPRSHPLHGRVLPGGPAKQRRR